MSFGVPGAGRTGHHEENLGWINLVMWVIKGRCCPVSICKTHDAVV